MKRLLGWGLLFWFCGGQVFAQITIPADAKVGLVLSGGGARGLAHVGVIRVLEAQGIKPEIITGTSMGSIVGALYASGMSAGELDWVARTMDWRQALNDGSPRKHQPYPFRQLEEGMTADFRISITPEGIGIPSGAIEGQHLEQQLVELFSRNDVGLKFEQLPIAFAAVAADLETGEMVVLNQGDLASAIRASMSIPGAIAPIERDGKLLVDGGIVNNMPIDLARQMGADYIIAVDVTAPLRKRDELGSLFAIAGQTTSFLVRLNTLKQRVNLRSDELLILPDLEGYGAASFGQGDDIIQAGYEAALQTFEVATVIDYAEEHSADAAVSEEPVIQFIRVANDSPISDQVIIKLIRQPLNQPLNKPMLAEDISKLYGLDYFSLVRYRVVKEAGRVGLQLKCIGRQTGNLWLKLGIELADDFEGNTDVGLAASIRAAGLNRLGGTLFGRLELGTTPEMELRFLQPLDYDFRYFVEPSIGYTAGRVDLYDPEERISEPVATFQKADYWASLALGRTLWGQQGDLRVGITGQRGDLDFRSGVPISELEETYEDGFYFAKLGLDTLDDLGFPTRGLRWELTQEMHRTDLNAESDFGRTLTDFTLAVSYDRHTLLLEGDASIADDDEASFADIPFIGGFLELSGLPPRARFGRHRALLRTVYYRRMNKLGPLPVGVPVYLGASLEKGNVWLTKDEIAWDSATTAGSLFVGARTPLGPAYISIGVTEEGDRSLSLFLGQRFR